MRKFQTHKEYPDPNSGLITRGHMIDGGGGVKIVNNEDKREEMKIEKLDEGTRVKYCYRKRNNL